MNYLAHTFLGAPDREAIVGQMLGDFARGLDVATLPAGIRAGLLRHRAIDVFTDAHPIVRDLRQSFGPPYRRFAGVILDVAFDHFLARHFARFSAAPLPGFTATVYEALGAHREWLPLRLETTLPRMAQDDWLASYGQIENVGRAFSGIARRMKHSNPMATALDPFLERYGAVDAAFLEFFPELVVAERAAREA